MRLGLLLSLGWLFFSASVPASAHTDPCEKYLTEPDSRAAALVVQKHYDARLEQYYNDHARREWEEAFQSEWQFFEQDPSGGPEKIRLLLRFGFRRVDGKVIAPSYTEFVHNYISYLDEIGVHKEDRMLPAVVLRRGAARQYEFRLVTPGVDAWPESPDFQFLEAASMFNIPFEVAFKAIQRGRFPLLEAAHDVSHFLSYAMNRAFTKTLIHQTRGLAKSGVSIETSFAGFPSASELKLFYTVEIMSLADPSKLDLMRAFLQTPEVKRAVGPVPFGDFEKHFAGLPEQDLLEHARKLSSSYHSFLVDYGGGAARSQEKTSELVNLVGDTPRDALLSALPGWRERMNNSAVVRSGLSTFPNTLNHMLAALSFNQVELSTINSSNRAFRDFPIDHSNLVRLIRKQVAKMEYALWESATRVDAVTWNREVLVAHPDPSSPAVQFVRNVMGEDSTLYRALTK